MSDTSPLPAGIAWLGADDPQRRLFDALIPLPGGTSYNAWLVRGATATALIDTLEAEHAEGLLARLAAAGVTRLDYVVANHAEQDHTGSLPQVLARYPEARLLATKRGVDMLVDLLPLPADRVDVVGEGDTRDLGGRTLTCLRMPWVHWPETMVTWVPEERGLFSCDLFGAHLPAGGGALPWEQAREAARLYYATIMAPFAGHVAKHVARVRALDPAWIAPSHGPVHLDPAPVLAAHEAWSAPPARARVVVAWVSMHGSTAGLARGLTRRLEERGVEVEAVDLGGWDVGALAEALLGATALALGASNVLNAIHPVAGLAWALVEGLKPPLRAAALFGSFGWSGKPLERLAAQMAEGKLAVAAPLLVKGAPGADQEAELDRLADDLVRLAQPSRDQA